MINQAVADKAFKDTRDFFKDGLKSDNKLYFSRFLPNHHRLAWAKDISFEVALARVEGRAENRGKANVALVGQRPVGDDPVAIGEAWVKDGRDFGNCGEMACVALYYASKIPNVLRTELFSISVTNPKFKHHSRGVAMTFGHSWALLGSDSSRINNYVVDAWAGICCKEQDYNARLRAKLDEWTDQGKQIGVTWASGDPDLVDANSDTITSLLRPDARRRSDPDSTWAKLQP